MKKLLVILLALLFLTACTPKTPTPQPEPTPPPVTEPIPEPAPLSYTVQGKTQSHNRDGVKIDITIPVLTGENQKALDIVNHYFTLLSGKVLDYAEGDLYPAAGASYYVAANYVATYTTENTISLLWQVVTSSSTDLMTADTQMAMVFDAKTGNLLTFSDLFGANADAARSWFVEEARRHIATTADTNYFYEQANALAESAFDPNSVLFDETGVTVFYPRDALGSVVVVSMPYDTAQEYLTLEP